MLGSIGRVGPPVGVVLGSVGLARPLFGAFAALDLGARSINQFS